MFDKLFSALDRKVEGFLKLTDCLLILSCVLKRFILSVRPDLFSSAILSEVFFTLFHVFAGFHDLSSPNVKLGALYFYTGIYQCLLFIPNI